MITALRIIDIILIVFLAAAGGDTLFNFKKSSGKRIEGVKAPLIQRLRVIMVLTVLVTVVTIVLVIAS